MASFLSGEKSCQVGSVLGPTLFLIFTNDLDIAVDIAGAMLKFFADNTKCYMVIESEQDRLRFQSMLSSLEQWSSDWQMMFNMDKCHVLHVGRKMLSLIISGVEETWRQLRKRRM